MRIRGALPRCYLPAGAKLPPLWQWERVYVGSDVCLLPRERVILRAPAELHMEVYDDALNAPVSRTWPAGSKVYLLRRGDAHNVAVAEIEEGVLQFPVCPVWCRAHSH